MQESIDIGVADLEVLLQGRIHSGDDRTGGLAEGVPRLPILCGAGEP